MGTLTKLKLPNVTLLQIETIQHKLARMAVDDCVRQADFGDVLIFTDKPQKFSNYDHIVKIEHPPKRIDWSCVLWNETAPHIRTSHVLCIQWDSWIWSPEMWRSEYLDYDYIGSPWWYDKFNVGNGGFSLRSTALTRWLRDHRDRYPCITGIDDDLLCRKYRPMLEIDGFTWAPERVARDFAFETTRPPEGKKTFGFHALYNFPVVLSEDCLMERLEIAMQSDHIKNNPHMLKGLRERNPMLVSKLARVADAT